MRSMTYKFSFLANSREEMLETIKDKISPMVDKKSDDPLTYVNYETTISDSNEDKKYLVEVVARVRND
jgi:hypothetical protein